MLLSPDSGGASPRRQATLAYEAIRSDIVAGRHGPDKKLKIQDMAAELSVSPGAVREALSRLVAAQFVVSRDQRGFAVAPLSIADLEELTDLRCEIEAIALRRSVERGGITWEAGLLAAAHRLRMTPPLLSTQPRRIDPAWIAAHAAFHRALVAGSGSPRIIALHAQLYEQSERYRGLSAQLDIHRNVGDEHQRIADLAIARDAEGLIAMTTDHLRMTTRLIADAVRRHEQPK